MKHIIDYSKKVANEFALGGSPVFGWILLLISIAAGAYFVATIIGAVWEII